MLEIILNRWLSIMFRGFVILGPMMLLFWIWRPRWVESARIPQLLRAKITPWPELPRSLLSLSTYVLPIPLLAFVKEKFGYSMMYTDIAEYGWFYFFASFLIFAVFIDTWFYWTHRAMHHFAWLKKSHGVHHRSLNVTPVTAYSFDIVEALINMAPIPILLFLVPWHPVMLFLYGIWGIFYVGYVHLGFDPFYKWQQKNRLFKWAYTATHHSVHHQRFQGNYAVYFMFWDRLMGTELKIEDLAHQVKPELRGVEGVKIARPASPMEA